MDFSFILVVVLSAMIASAWMIYVAVTDRDVSNFRTPFLVSYAIAVLLMQPWRISSAQEAGMAVMMLLFMSMWIAVGWLIGASPTALVLAAARRLSGMRRGSAK